MQCCFVLVKNLMCVYVLCFRVCVNDRKIWVQLSIYNSSTTASSFMITSCWLHLQFCSYNSTDFHANFLNIIKVTVSALMLMHLRQYVNCVWGACVQRSSWLVSKSTDIFTYRHKEHITLINVLIALQKCQN